VSLSFLGMVMARHSPSGTTGSCYRRVARL
jgi:hypothetical protein